MVRRILWYVVSRLVNLTHEGSVRLRCGYAAALDLAHLENPQCWWSMTMRSRSFCRGVLSFQRLEQEGRSLARHQNSEGSYLTK